jgi:molecular chaperone DnaK
MPSVRQLARELLGKEPYRYIDPDTVVARGAAIQAGMLLGMVEKAVLLDVLPLSLGVVTQGGLMARILGRNTPLPASEARIFTTAEDGQPAMDIQVLQGERALAADNILLGRFQLDGIPNAPRGVPKVEVAIDADVDGIVHISARELLSDSEVEVKLVANKLLDQWEIERVAEDARQSASRDQEHRQRIEAGIKAENLIALAEEVLNRGASPLEAGQVREVARALRSLRDALGKCDLENLNTDSKVLRQLLATIYQART